MALAGRNNGVTRNELSHDSAGSLDTESEGVDINENDVTERLVTREDTTLDSSTVRNGLVRVDTLRRLLAKVLFEELLDFGDTSRSADQDDLGG